MKQRRRLIAIICTALVCLAVIAYLVWRISPTLSAERNHEASMGYNKLMIHFGLPGTTRTKLHYPEGYGGAYIGKDDVLVIQITKDAGEELSRKALSEIMELRLFKIRRVKHSFNELVTENNAIGSYNPWLDPETGKLRPKPDAYFDGKIVQNGIDTKNNSVVVWLRDISPESIEAFREHVSDAPFVKFELAVGEGPVLQ